MSVHLTIRRRLAEAMQARRLTAREVAERSGYSAYYVRGVQRGRYGNPTIGAVWALAGALEVDPGWLLGLDDRAPP